MKRKIGEIYNKPIVTGDKNLVTKNEVHESTLGDADVNKKYGYYKISSDIFDIVKEGKTDLILRLLGAITFVKNCELNGRTSFSRGAGEFGIDAYVNTPITTVVGNLITEEHGRLPYCSREYFNMGIMVDESDMNYLAFVNGNKFDVPFKGTLLERLELLEMVDVIPYFIPITKEEYENLSNEFKE